MGFVDEFIRQTKLPKTKAEFYAWWKYIKQPFLSALTGIVILLLVSPFLIYWYFANDLSSKEAIMNSNNAGVLLLDRTGKPFFSLFEARERSFVPLSQIPKNMQDAVIATEDKDFYKHPGFSLTGIARSVILDVQKGELAYGGSTITQQLVKNALLTSQKNFLRKYQELILAAEIERRYSKEEILEMYLNSVYFGEGALGVDDAAKIYFGKKVTQLTLAESALLAGILPAPSALSPISGDKEKAFKRQITVLDKMLAQNYITSEEKEAAQKQQITFSTVKPPSLSLTAPHFALMVKQQLLTMYSEDELTRSGFRVKTTLNLTFQKEAERVVKNQIRYLQYNKATNAGVVAEDPKTGEILALVGSYDWNDEDFGKFNITTANRQPGSAFKPIIYAKAFAEETITPGTILEDKRNTFSGNFTPKNYDGKFRGPVLPRYALANSLNIPAVEVMEKVGVGNGIMFAKLLGITTLKDPSNYGLSLVLGGAEVPLLELTNAYAVFASGGEKPEITTILEVTNKREQIIYTATPKKQSVLDPRVAFLISSILSDNKVRADVFGNALTISRPAAVKTGTTNDYRDALTVGYTPSLVIGVWVGNNDNTPMNNIAGSLGAAPIWKLLMEAFLKGTPIEHFTPPSDLNLVRICKDNGLKSNIATSSAYFEYFLQGTDPKRNCNEVVTPSPTSLPTSEPTQTPQPSESFESNTPTPSPTTVVSPTPSPILPTPTDILPTPQVTITSQP